MTFLPFTQATPGRHVGRVSACPRNDKAIAAAECAMQTVRCLKLAAFTAKIVAKKRGDDAHRWFTL